MSYYWEPFSYITYLDVKSRVTDNMPEDEIAAVFAAASNKLAGLHADLNDPDYVRIVDKIEQSYAMWGELQEEMYCRIVSILQRENDNVGTHVLSGIGTHYIVLPFMERNGYRDSGGWWIENNDWDERDSRRQ